MDLPEDEKSVESPTKTTRNWFLSLSRRRTNNENNLNLSNRSTGRVSSESDLQNCDRGASTTATPTKTSTSDDRNVFQRIKRKMEKKFSRQRKFPSPTNLPQQRTEPEQDPSENASAAAAGSGDEAVNLSKDDQRMYLSKKWLQGDSGPNQIMYQACTEMLSHAWYWGEISRHDAQRQLTGKPNGSFLVRNSESNGPQFTLSFRIGNCTLHYRIQHRDNYWHFEARQYESIVEMIEDIMQRSTDEKFICYVKAPCEMQPPFPVILKYPISRYSKIAQLQDLCRRVIRRHNRPNEIENLPIPAKLQQYLTEETTLFF